MIELMLAAVLMQDAAACSAVPPPPAAAGCPRWRAMDRDEVGEVSVAPGSVRPSGDGFEVDLRLVLHADERDGSRSVISHYYFDCATRTTVRRRIASFDARGRLLAERVTPEGAAPPRPALPGSNRAALFDEFCPR